MTRPEENLSQQADAARSLIAHISDGEDEVLLSDMIEGETDLFEAIDVAISAVREAEVIAAGCAHEISVLTERKNRADRRVQTVRAAIEQAMLVTGINTIQRPTKTLSISHRAGKAVITDETQIPSEFFSPQPPKLDKSALNKAVADRTIPGAHLGNGTVSLTIRSK